jgi:uncharacterized 2Fe-2S/4Fe-4S cluster protein (DUF4445 family)
MPFTIRVLAPEPRTIEAPPGISLASALTGAGIPLNVYCGGRGACGRCWVEVLEGVLPPPADSESALLRARKAPRGVRLACMIEVQSDLALKMPAEALLGEIQGLSEGILPSLAFDPPVKRLLYNLAQGPAPSPLPESLAPGLYTATAFDGRELLDLASGEASQPLCGLAVDLGTTTVAVELVELGGGRILGKAVGLNRQARFGADLISRISHAVRDPDRAADLRLAALETIAGLQARVCKDARMPAGAIYDVVVAGNTVMNHLLLGRPVQSLAEAPFDAGFLGLPALGASASGFDVHRRAKLFISPNIGSYVGGDITAGLVATGMLGRAGNALFVDLGTNGEIVLKSGDGIRAASTAAGPAFEGAGLSCGALAVPGAIDKAAWSEGGGFSVSVIGGGAPAGICGTGYIDLLAHFLRRGLVSPSGLLSAPGGSVEVAPGVSIGQKDIRELQLAVAAVRTGIELLLRRAGLGPSDLDIVYLAGAFGSTLDAANARRIGLLPDVETARLRFVGNTSLAGARAMLLSRFARSAAAAVAERIEHVSLASDSAFQDTYIRSLAFPGTEAGE